MADGPYDDDPVLTALSALRDPEPDPALAERTRERCRRHLARRRRRTPDWVAWIRPWARAMEAALLAALALVYLGDAVQRAEALLRR